MIRMPVRIVSFLASNLRYPPAEGRRADAGVRHTPDRRDICRTSLFEAPSDVLGGVQKTALRVDDFVSAEPNNWHDDTEPFRLNNGPTH